MVINKKKLMPYLIMVVMLLIPYLQFLVSGAATAKAASTETEVAITTGDAGSAKAYYSIDKTNHQINWRLRLNQVAADKMRHAEFAIENVGTGLGEVTGLQVKDAATGAVTKDFVQTAKSGVNWQIGADAQTQKDYEVTFQTAYQSDSETTLQLKFAYKIEQAITETSTKESDSATTATPAESTPAVTESSASSITTESGTNTQAITESTTDQAATSDDALQVAPTQSSSSASLQPTAVTTQPVAQPTSYENSLAGEQVVTIAPEVVAEESEETAESDSLVSEEPAGSVSSDESKAEDKDDTEVTETDKDTRATSASGSLLKNGATVANLNFYSFIFDPNPDPNGRPAQSIDMSYNDSISFNMNWSGVHYNYLEYRTADGSNNWTQVRGGLWDQNWSGNIDLSELEDNELDQIVATNNDNGTLTFENINVDQTAFLQFRVRPWEGLGYTFVSDKFTFTSTGAKFKLTVPELNFGDIETFDQQQAKDFDINLEQNTASMPFTLTATSTPAEGTTAETDPFRREDLLFSQNGGEKVMEPGEEVPLIENQVTLPDDHLTFAVKVPARTYDQGTYTSDINWKLKFNN